MVEIPTIYGDLVGDGLWHCYTYIRSFHLHCHHCQHCHHCLHTESTVDSYHWTIDYSKMAFSKAHMKVCFPMKNGWCFHSCSSPSVVVDGTMAMEKSTMVTLLNSICHYDYGKIRLWFCWKDHPLLQWNPQSWRLCRSVTPSAGQAEASFGTQNP